MNRMFQTVLWGLLAMWILAPFPSAEAGDQELKATPRTPVRISREAATGLGLEKVAWPDERRNARWSFLFEGDELSVSVFESAPIQSADAISRHKVTDYPYDEFVLVLSGKAVLIGEDGKAHEFIAGDYFVVPKGFTGIWEEHGIFRELIVIEKEAVRTRALKISPADK